MTPATPELEALIQRVEKLESLEKRSRRMRLAWFLGGTFLLFMLIYVLSDIGSGLVKALERLDGLEGRSGQVSPTLDEQGKS